MFLACDTLTLGYGARPILQQFSLSMAPGALTALLGANGCGKSTLLKAMAGQLSPQ